LLLYKLIQDCSSVIDVEPDRARQDAVLFL